MLARQVFVAAVGDAGDPLTWSGIPYHLTEAGKAAGFVAAGLPLDSRGRRWQTRRVLWNLGRLVRGDRRGGYQYSPRFLEALWRPVRSRLRGAAVINCFQLYPPSIANDEAVEKWSYIDLTLNQLFDYYELRPTVGRGIAAEAIVRERQGYARARGIITMSHFAAESVHRDYGVPRERIHVVVPGANLDPAAYARWEESARGQRSSSPGPLRLVMVTTDWKRKGLDRLLRALVLARARGLEATLKVIGSAREELPPELTAAPGVEWLGRIKKDAEAGRFLHEVATADVGCIFSRYEAGGSVLREYHALGLAAFATTAGGMPDFMFEEASVTVAPDATDDEICAALLTLGDPTRLAELRQAAWQRRREALWQGTVQRLRAAMEHET